MRLKGETTIELADVKTNEVTVIKEENFITDALHQLCQPVFKGRYTLESASFTTEGGCSTEALTRGLLLFDSRLEEDASILVPPVGVNMVGHGCEAAYLGTDKTMGSYNSGQSNIGSETERTYIWDFSSEQANGIINSICLTTQAGGYIGHGVKVSMEEVAASMRPFSNITKAAILVRNDANLADINKVPVYLSLEGDFIVQCDFQRVTSGILYFNKIYLESDSVDVFKQFPQHDNVEDISRLRSYAGVGYTKIETIQIDASAFLGTGTYFGMAQDGKYLYITDLKSSSEANVSNAWAPETKIKLVKVNLETFAHEEIEVTNTTGVSVGIRVTASTMAEGSYTFGVASGYMYVRGWVGTTGNDAAPLYAINLASNTDVKQVTSEDGSTNMVGISSTTTSTPFMMTHNGLATFTHARTKPSIVETGANGFVGHAVVVKGFKKHFLGASASSFHSVGAIIQTTTPHKKEIAVDSDLYFAVKYESSSTTGSLASTESVYFLNVNPTVLMTVNNLTTPIEKTPAQTMRITYRLTKAE